MLRNLCANHSRNLPIDAFNRLYEDYLTETLGGDFEAAVKATGSKA